MKCLICNQAIKSGEQIFWGNQMACAGPGESDCSYVGASNELVGAIHLSCLKSPAGAAKRIIRPIEEVSESVVERSDALAMFDL